MYEVLIALVVIANIESFSFQVKQEYKQEKRMTKNQLQLAL